MARAFNGTSDQIVLPLVSTNTKLVNMSCWCYPTDLTGTRIIFHNGVYGTNGFGLFSTCAANTNTGKISAIMDNTIMNSSVALTLNAWSQVVLRIDTSTFFWVWVNDNQTLFTNNIPTQPSTRTCIGSSSGANFFAGYIADFAFWDIDFYPPSTGEWDALAQGDRPRRIRPLSRKAWLPLDGYASPEPDFSGSGNNGVLTGTTLAPTGPPMNMFTPRWPHNELPVVPATKFRKTASRIGTRAGTRQTWAA